MKEGKLIAAKERVCNMNEEDFKAVEFRRGVEMRFCGLGFGCDASEMRADKFPECSPTKSPA
jgi:hypothetical protein